MNRIALSLLTPAIASTTIPILGVFANAPIAFAAPDFDQLRRDNLEKGAISE